MRVAGTFMMISAVLVLLFGTYWFARGDEDYRRYEKRSQQLVQDIGGYHPSEEVRDMIMRKSGYAAGLKNAASKKDTGIYTLYAGLAIFLTGMGLFANGKKEEGANQTPVEV